MYGVSVVICCYNGAPRLPETLRHLAAQEIPTGAAFEVVIIDNGSTDGTMTSAPQHWPAGAPGPLRVVSEPKRGTGNARYRGFMEAQHEILSFLDDDNWIDPGWIARVLAFFAAHPEAAAVGGPSEGVFEDREPAWFPPMENYFAVGEQHRAAGDITEAHGTLLWTAGMSMRLAWVRRITKLGFRFINFSDESLPIYSGEDTELCFALREAGARLFYEPTLGIRHFMPTARLEWPSALHLMHRIGGCAPVINIYLIALNRFPFAGQPAWRKSWLSLLLRAIRDLVLATARHPLAAWRRSPGSLVALRREAKLAQLATLWILRGRFETLRRTIASAPWAQGAREC